ncbi:hypothetical protein [Chamaesiphon sp. OTE_75_metabat_556]|nr:hypothetical protein [Chamaesiphon sp. OTE_75_metabat_556]
MTSALIMFKNWGITSLATAVHALKLAIVRIFASVDRDKYLNLATL